MSCFLLAHVMLVVVVVEVTVIIVVVLVCVCGMSYYSPAARPKLTHM